MTSNEPEIYGSRLIAVASINIPSGHRKSSPKTVASIADSIPLVGLLQPIGVVPGKADGEYDLVFGGNRLAAHKRLKLDVIEAEVFDIDPENAEIATHVENLFCVELSTKDKLTAIAVWAAHYKSKHPESFGSTAMANGAAEMQQAKQEAKAIPGAGNPGSPKEPKVARPSTALAKLTGKGHSQSALKLRIAENLDESQREALCDRGVSQERMGRIAGITELGERTKAVNLIASGMDIDTAIVLAQAPANATLEIVQRTDLDGYKPEEEMTDEEWFNGYCGETAARLTHVESYKSSAILWRNTRPMRHEFRLGIKKDMTRFNKLGSKGPLYSQFAKLVNLCHPKDWPVCGPCGGTGMARNRSKCLNCYGHAFAIKSEPY